MSTPLIYNDQLVEDEDEDEDIFVLFLNFFIHAWLWEEHEYGRAWK